MAKGASSKSEIIGYIAGSIDFPVKKAVHALQEWLFFIVKTFSGVVSSNGKIAERATHKILPSRTGLNFANLGLVWKSDHPRAQATRGDAPPISRVGEGSASYKGVPPLWKIVYDLQFQKKGNSLTS